MNCRLKRIIGCGYEKSTLSYIFFIVKRRWQTVMMNMTVVKEEINSDVNGMITRDEMTEDVLGNMTGTNTV